MRIIRDTNNVFSSNVRRIGSSNRSITRSLIVVFILSLCVLVVDIIS